MRLSITIGLLLAILIGGQIGFADDSDIKISIITQNENELFIRSELSRLGIQESDYFDNFDSPNSVILVPTGNVLTMVFTKPREVSITKLRMFYSQYINTIRNNIDTRLTADYKDLPKLDEQKLEVNFMLGLSLYLTKHCNYAVSYLESAIEFLPLDLYSTPGTHYPNLLAVLSFYRGTCGLELNDYDAAIKFLRLSLYSDFRLKSLHGEIPGSVSNYATAINLAWAYFQWGMKDEAFKLLDHFTQEIPWPNTKVKVFAYRAQLYVLDNRYDEAITDLNTAIELAPDDPTLYLLRAQTYLLLYEWDKVLADCNKAIELDPTYAEAYYQRGLLYYSILQTGSSLYEEALADFEMYLDLAPNGNHAEQAAEYITEIEALMRALGG